MPRMGPLSGIKVLELPNIGPLQFAGMILSDLGAEVLRLDRKAHVEAGVGLQGPVTEFSVMDRGRRSAGIDLKHADAAAVVLRLCERADILVEGFRPGVAERLGVGPVECRARNPRLVYGRMTGWGQEGPLASDVGHDLNYIALAGVLHHIGPAGGPPVPPLNLVADFGGGGLLLVMGLLAALVERSISGEGQVVDAAMIDGAALQMSIFYAIAQMGTWGPRGTNVLDGGAPWYGVYETADGQWITLASFEPQFYLEFLDVLGLDADPADQWNHAQWPAMKEQVAQVVRTRTRDEWVETMAGRDVCFAPVLPMLEALEHPHHVARDTFVEVGGVRQPAPAPRFSRTPAAQPRRPLPSGHDTDQALGDWGFGADEIEKLRDTGVIA
jgi:alpha-methylacyl-CoA racemase